MKKLIAALVLLATPAFAADVNPLANIVKAPVAAPCTTTGCAGFYVGLDVTGIGTNLDVIGSGVNGSLNANGTLLGGHVGYQTWNDRWFGAVEAGCSYDVAQNVSAIGGTNSNRFLCTEVVKGGGLLQQLLGTQFGSVSTAAPSQGPLPFTVPAALSGALITPFVTVGAAQRYQKNGFVAGAGAQFLLSANWNVGLEYMHINYNKGQVATGQVLDTENLIRLSLNYHFGK